MRKFPSIYKVTTNQFSKKIRAVSVRSLNIMGPTPSDPSSIVPPNPLLSSLSDGERRHRENLAAAFRFFKKQNMDEGLANHFSFVLSPEINPEQFLVQPFGRDFGTVKASDLVLVDLANPSKWMQSFLCCSKVKRLFIPWSGPMSRGGMWRGGGRREGV